MVLKNTGVAHVMIVQKSTLPFEFLFLRRETLFNKMKKDIVSRKYFTCLYYPKGDLKS